MGDAVNAHQLGSYALAHFGVVMGLAQDGKAGVGVEVDEAGADDVAGGVNHSHSIPAQVGVAAAVDGKGVAGDGDGSVEAGAAGAVDNLAAADKQVNHGGMIAQRGCAGRLVAVHCRHPQFGTMEARYE